ncbi:MAG: zwf [Frankiales bacterium]|nr:zwf [Frankiales bacterium]
MVLPAFYTLAQRKLLPERWLLVGNGRGDVAHEDFRAHVRGVLAESGPQPADGPWQEFASRLLFAGGGFNSDDPGSLLDVLSEARGQLGDNAQLVHYFAVPPSAFVELTRAIGEHRLAAGSRVVYEKPFGTSREGFIALDKAVHAVLDESQVYRIDHFLGKEATQNLHTMRFANELFAAAWSRQHIASVQIDVPEQIGVTDRSVFYDSTGAVLDMLVTHLFQVAAEVAMEPPASLGAEDLQAAREKTIAAFRPLALADVVLGQFEGYQDLDGVRQGSRTETFVAARLWIDNDRWRGVPFLLRTGKRMHASHQRVSVVFRTAPGPFGALADGQNVLSFEMSGNGQIELDLLAKRPGPELNLEAARVQLSLADLPDAEPLAPYVRLIHDVLLGDRSLFTRPDGLRAVWEVADPLLSGRDHRGAPLSYAPGSWGPHAAAELIAPDRWLLGQ